LDRTTNRLIVGDDAELRTTTFVVRNVNWISERQPAKPFEAEVKIRHRHDPALATVTPQGEAAAQIIFREPQRAVTPGQAAVFYHHEVVLGGGWIR
jgi:tRNA-specific 2-thiouridylase